MDITTALRDRGVGVGKKLKGNAKPVDVRAGKTFSSVDGTDLLGTLPVQATAGQVVTPTTTNIIKAAGIYDGPITVEGSASLVAANIKAGANIFGVTGKTQVVDTTEATASATAAQIRTGRVAFVNGVKVIGTMAVGSTVGTTITPGKTNQVLGAGVYDGPITVEGDADLLAANIRAGVFIFGVEGNPAVIDTTIGATQAVPSNILTGRSAFVNGALVNGAMPNHGAYNVTPGPTAVVIPEGYHTGAGKVATDANLKTENIAGGVTIFGVPGSADVYTTARKAALIAEINAMLT